MEIPTKQKPATGWSREEVLDKTTKPYYSVKLPVLLIVATCLWIPDTLGVQLATLSDQDQIDVPQQQHLRLKIIYTMQQASGSTI